MSTVIQVKKNIFIMIECHFSHKNLTKIKLGSKTKKICCFIHFQQQAINHLIDRIDWFLPRMLHLLKPVNPIDHPVDPTDRFWKNTVLKT